MAITKNKTLWILSVALRYALILSVLWKEERGGMSEISRNGKEKIIQQRNAISGSID